MFAATRLPAFAGGALRSHRAVARVFPPSRACVLQRGRFATLSIRNEVTQFEGADAGTEGLVSTVGTPVPAPLAFLADKQLSVISFTALVTAGLTAILVAAAIPSLLAIKKAAEAIEKLAETAREELPGTMAAIRLSGMEISDLTMELNDLGQEISKGVRSSARVLSSAETNMRQVGGIASNVWQEQAVVPVQAMQPLVAKTARQMRDSLVQTRTLVRNLQVLSRVSGWIGSLQARTPILILNSDKKKSKS